VSTPTVILCIDDEPNILMLRQIILSIAGYKVLTATNPKSAMQLFVLNDVDLVITDQLLPGRTGSELIAEMKQIKPEVPIILYTGLMEPPADAGNADLILVKGMTPPEFLAAISQLVAKPKSTGPETP
jgi:CheY-like chemotaxis protein